MCNWEDDGQDEQDADEVRGGPNLGMSLETARLNFESHLVMYEPGNDPRISKGDSEAVQAVKRDVVAAFSAMQEGPGSDHEPLWECVLMGERNLYRLLKETIRDYELRSRRSARPS